MSYLDVPHVVTNSAAERKNLARILKVAAAGTRAQAVRGIQYGDSRSTPSGQGNIFNSHFNYEFGRAFNNIPETPCFDSGINGHMGLGCPFSGMGATTRTASYSPHDFEGSHANSVQAAVGFTDVTPLAVLEHNFDQAGASLIPTNVEHFKRSFDGVGPRLECLVARLNGTSPNPNFSSLFWKSVEKSDSNPSYFDTVVASGTIDISVAQGAEGPVFSFLTPPHSWATTPTAANISSLFLQYQVGSNSGTQKVDVLGWIIRSAARRGVAMTFMGRGGATSATLLAERPNCYNTMSAIKPDFVFLQYGVNDSAGTAMTKATFKANMVANVAWIQANVTNFDGFAPLVILGADPDRDMSTAAAGEGPARAVFDVYADAQAEIAAATPGVIFFNDRLRLEQMYLWKQGLDLATNAPDGVHPGELGASRWARLRVQSLLSAGGFGFDGGRWPRGRELIRNRWRV